ncbi:MAG: thiamine pyrophosphate-dependent dehydrogenase E1 component subunit alpha [Acidobacteria bacterium]|nr:thiamine pyrophosphate-dependent dehydrogenase E1 component subunit alpha [Acidobacteriota bacterium]
MAVENAALKPTLLDLYRTMTRIRTFEETAHKEFLKGKMPGFLHLYSGQEAIAAGVMSVLQPDDYISSHHRGHGHLIAKGADTGRMFAELFGRVDGFCRGKGGSMHIADSSLNILGANGVVGACVHIGTGAAFACKHKHRGRVSVIFLGDAATNRGTFHEALNLAAIWDLPAVYVVENNLYGVANCQRDYMKVEVAGRAAGYGFPGVTVDGNDVAAVREAAGQAVARARAGQGPTLLDCRTWRHWGHFIGDAAAYRDPEEHKAWLKRDPLILAADLLRSEKWATQADLDRIQAEAEEEMLAALDFGKNSPLPGKEELYTHVYTG